MYSSLISGHQLKKLKKYVKATVTPELFRKEYESVFTDNERWNAIETSTDVTYIHLMIIQLTFKTHHSLKAYQKNQEN